MPASFNVRWDKDAFDDEQVTVAAVSIGLTSTKYAPAASGGTPQLGPAEYALITVETADIRWRVSGSAATATGHLAPQGSTIELRGRNNIKQFRAIRNAGVSAVLTVTYAR